MLSSPHALRDVEDLVLLVQLSPYVAEQLAALKVAARVVAMSPVDGDAFVNAGLLRVCLCPTFIVAIVTMTCKSAICMLGHVYG